MTTCSDLTPLVTAAHDTMTEARLDRMGRLDEPSVSLDLLDRHHEAEQVVLAVLEAQRAVEETL